MKGKDLGISRLFTLVARVLHSSNIARTLSFSSIYCRPVPHQWRGESIAKHILPLEEKNKETAN
jgi:hypothetical protein